MRSTLTLILLSLFALGCSPQAQTSSVQAPSLIAASFVVVPESENNESPTTNLTPTKDTARIRINKLALEKEFLWHAELVPQISVPKFNGLKSRVVAFRLRGDQLFMVESTQGHVISEDLPITLILASFPVTFQNDSVVEFDFNKGMSEIYAADEWRASDFTGAAYQGAGEFISLTVKHSYIHSAKMNNQNELVIIQRGVIDQQPMGLGNVNTPVETRYYFTPYIANANYSPLRTVNFDRMGFFEVAPQQAKGSAVDVFASRFDPSRDKTITYAVSSNTPEDYKQAVRDGILYWNRAFGYEKIKVVDAPAGVTAPDSEYNIVQWVEWDSAGGAYADAQADPRTGEIRHAQVFMTSAFAFSSRNRARALLRELNTPKIKSTSLSLGGLAHSALCDRDNTDHLQQLLTDVIATDVPDSRILGISQDYIREVVAHEVGHTLGLRHNFAGNLSANFDMSDLDAIYEVYAKSETLPKNILFTSSVMEYQFFTSSVMSGKLLKDVDVKAFPYDKAAIDVLYGGVELAAANAPLFCTDTHQGKYIGCIVWDQGSSPLADMLYNEKKAMETLAQGLVEKVILVTTPPSNLPVTPIQDTFLYPEVVAKMLLSKRSLATQLLTEKVRDLRVQRSFGKVDGVNADLVAEKTYAAAAAEITRLGGLKTLLALPSASLANNWIDSFNTLIDSKSYREGIGYNGKPYKLSDSDVAAAKELAAQYFVKVQEYLAQADIDSLSTNGMLSDTALSDEFADILGNRMSEYLFSESGEVIRDRVMLGESKSAILSLPVYKYTPAVRVAASKLLVGRSSVAPDWGLAQHDTVKSTYQEKVKSVLMGNEINSIRADKNPREVSKWLLEIRAILTTLSARD